MRIAIVTLFPEFFESPLHCGLLQRAQAAGIIDVSLVNPRDYATDKHHCADDRPYGGGPGMVMLPGPISAALQGLGFAPRSPVSAEVNTTEVAVHSPCAVADSSVCEVKAHAPGCDPSAQAVSRATQPAQSMPVPPVQAPGRLIFVSPKGRPLTQALARELAEAERLTIICGRYEGMDARVEELFPVECVSVGDFVLNGGEVAALCLVEAVGRLLPGFMGHESSGDDESFSHGLLEYPHYTRPEVFNGLAVPTVLREGNHAHITAWRRAASCRVTFENRPELLSEAPLLPEDREELQQMSRCRVGRNLYCGLVHYPVLDKQKNSVAVSLTNLDIHDIARSSCTYGLGRYYVVTPLEDQRRLLSEILAHWTQGAGKLSNPCRDEALSLVGGVACVDDAVQDIYTRTGQMPMIVGTSARPEASLVKGFQALREVLRHQPVLLLFGTGHGLAPELECHAFAPPLRWHGGYNHLSVRAAAAIIFDRILGDWH